MEQVSESELGLEVSILVLMDVPLESGEKSEGLLQLSVSILVLMDVPLESLIL